jgi:hypothetical protein
MILDPQNYKIIASDNFISEFKYFNTEQYSFSKSKSKISFKCLEDADQMVVAITNMYDKSEPKSTKIKNNLGIFLFQGKYFYRLTDRMVFKEIGPMKFTRENSDTINGLKSIHFANNIFENNYYLLVNFRNKDDQLTQIAYKINSRFPQPYAYFDPKFSLKSPEYYELNGNKMTCEYSIKTGYVGKQILLKTVKINYGIQEKLEIFKRKELVFSEQDMERKEIALEDYYNIKGNLYRAILAGKNGWRLTPRLILTNYKFLGLREDF